MSEERDEELEIEPDESEEDQAHVEYDIATYPSDNTLSVICEMFEAKDIEIPDFQRSFIWSIKQSSLLIDSFLMGLPVPAVFFYIDEENKSVVIDGQQRILSVVYFFEGYFGPESPKNKRQVFRLQGLSSNSKYRNKKFVDLSESDQRKLKSAVLRAINIKQLSPADDTSMYHIFERLNTGGTPLKPQEIRNCVFRGAIVSSLKNLNENQDWRKILGKANFDKHQKDVELVLRLFALTERMHEYEKPMKEFLNKTMRLNRSASSNAFSRFAKNFPLAASTILDQLGTKPFHIRGPLNTSVLDAVFCTILGRIQAIPEDLEERYLHLLDDEDFIELTYGGTTDTANISTRFQVAYEHLIE